MSDLIAENIVWDLMTAAEWIMDTNRDGDNKGTFQRYMEALARDFDDDLGIKLAEYISLYCNPLECDDEILPFFEGKYNLPVLKDDNDARRKFILYASKFFDVRGTELGYKMLGILCGLQINIIYHDESWTLDSDLILDDTIRTLDSSDCVKGCYEYSILVGHDGSLTDEIEESITKIIELNQPIRARLRQVTYASTLVAAGEPTYNPYGSYNEGIIQITASGGTAPYTYELILLEEDKGYNGYEIEYDVLLGRWVDDGLSVPDAARKILDNKFIKDLKDNGLIGDGKIERLHVLRGHSVENSDYNWINIDYKATPQGTVTWDANYGYTCAVYIPAPSGIGASSAHEYVYKSRNLAHNNSDVRFAKAAANSKVFYNNGTTQQIIAAILGSSTNTINVDSTKFPTYKTLRGYSKDAGNPKIYIDGQFVSHGVSTNTVGSVETRLLFSGSDTTTGWQFACAGGYLDDAEVQILNSIVVDYFNNI